MFVRRTAVLNLARAGLSAAIIVVLCGTPALAKPTPEGFTQTALFVAPDAAEGDGFGYSVAFDDAVAVAGAYRNDGMALDAGAAYVFEESDSGWSEAQVLRPADLGYDDRFGQAVAVSGDTLIVGAPRDDDLGTDCGAAYVFTRTVEGWVQTAKLLPVGGITFGRVGASVDIDGDTAILAGGRKVYVFVRTLEGWVLQATLMSPSGVYDYFGCSIAISGDTVAVGAHGFDSIYDEGRAYVFAREGGVWSLQTTLAAPDGVSNDQFGFGLDVSGDIALVGAWGDDDFGTSSGSAYVFERAGESWSYVTKLLPQAAAPYDYMGYHVSLDGALAVVSAHGDDQGGIDSGAAYAFDGGGWAQLAKIISSDSGQGGLLGNPSVSGERVLVGAYGSDTAAVDAGVACLFETGGGDTRPGPGPGGPGTKPGSLRRSSAD